MFVGVEGVCVCVGGCVCVWLCIMLWGCELKIGIMVGYGSPRLKTFPHQRSRSSDSFLKEPSALRQSSLGRCLFVWKYTWNNAFYMLFCSLAFCHHFSKISVGEMVKNASPFFFQFRKFVSLKPIDLHVHCLVLKKKKNTKFVIFFMRIQNG